MEGADSATKEPGNNGGAVAAGGGVGRKREAFETREPNTTTGMGNALFALFGTLCMEPVLLPERRMLTRIFYVN